MGALAAVLDLPFSLGVQVLALMKTVVPLVDMP